MENWLTVAMTTTPRELAETNRKLAGGQPPLINLKDLDETRSSRGDWVDLVAWARWGVVWG